MELNGTTQCELVHEIVGGEVYEYYPLGDHIVAARGVCGGRPTFKYTRIEATGALNLLAAGYSTLSKKGKGGRKKGEGSVN